MFSSKNSLKWALEFMKLPEKEGPFKKRKYTKSEISKLIGIKRSDNIYGNSSFIGTIERNKGINLYKSNGKKMKFYTLNKSKAFKLFMKDDFFRKFAYMFRDMVYDGDL